jgi:hypothetical protein
MQGRDDEARLTDDIIELARQCGRYGYRKIGELLRRAGWLDWLKPWMFARTSFSLCSSDTIS